MQEWLTGIGPMPQETRNYVSAITGSNVEEWAKAKHGKKPELPHASSCRELIAPLNQTPNRFVAQLEHRVSLAAAKRWGVQIAAGFDRDNALAMYARAIQRLNQVIGSRDDPSLTDLLFRSRGTSSFYHVRFGTDTRRQADYLCSRIRNSGGACLVKRSTDTPSATVSRYQTLTQLHGK